MARDPNFNFVAGTPVFIPLLFIYFESYTYKTIEIR